MPIAGTGGTVFAVRASPATTGTVNPPVTPTRHTAGSVSPA